MPDTTSELRWFKSSYSGSSSSECVETAIPAGPCIYVRDSKDRGGDMISFTADAWAAFMADVTTSVPAFE